MKQKRVYLLVAVILIALLGVLGLSYTAETAAAQSRPLSVEQGVSNATCSLEVEYLTPTPEEERPIRATATYNTEMPEGWHLIEWGDGSDHGWQGLSGEEIVQHSYESDGPFTVTLMTDAIDGDEEKCWDSVEVSVVPQPAGDFSLEVFDTAGFGIYANGWYSNSLDWGSCITSWGDGAAEVCFPGFEGTFDGVEHYYDAPGVYEVTMEVVGQNDTHTVTHSVTIDAPPNMPTGTLYVEAVAGIPLAVTASGTYSNSVGSWNVCLNWMDPEDPNDVCFDGQNGEFAAVGHTYPAPGVYTPTLFVTGTASTAEIPFTIDLSTDESPPTMTHKILLPIVMAPPAPPPTLVVDMYWLSAYEVEFTVNIQNAHEDWHVFYFGDGPEYGLHGNGEFVFKHTYNPGTYTATIEVSGPGGTTKWSETIVSPPPRPED